MYTNNLAMSKIGFGLNFAAIVLSQAKELKFNCLVEKNVPDCYHYHYMDGTYETKRYAADKIVLLGLFIAALLIARLITASKSAIVLSGPIKLNHTGLSVSIPAGNGWQSEKRWKYQENAFTLSSVFAPGSVSGTALAHCRYLLAAADVSADIRFKQKAAELGGVIVKTDQTQADMLTIDWVHIKRQKTLDTFFGTVRLPNHRQLDIQVQQHTADIDLAEQVFKSITESLKFEDNRLLEAGTEIIAEIKNIGLSYFLNSRNRQAFFLIKDAKKRTIGFTMDMLIESEHNGPLNIQHAGLFYMPRHHRRQRAMAFQSDNRFDQFVWKSEAADPTARTGTRIVLDETGLMTVRKLGPRAKEKKYLLNPAAIPNCLAEIVFEHMLGSRHREILVDIINSDGTVNPTLVSKIDDQHDTGAAEKAAYVLKLEFLDGQSFAQQIYFDDQKRISKILLQKEQITFERTDAENIISKFPKWADYILQKNKMLRQNQPRY